MACMIDFPITLRKELLLQNKLSVLVSVKHIY